MKTDSINAYDGYRDLAFLYVIFLLCKGKIQPISADTVQRNFLRYFPKEKNYINLLQRAEVMESVTLEKENLTLTEIGRDSADRLGDPIKRKIENQICIEAEVVEEL